MYVICCRWASYWERHANYIRQHTIRGGEDYTLSRLLYSFCTVAVSTFILISGYFGINFNWRKILKIWFSVLFFSWVIVIYKIIGQNDIKGCLPYFLPIISNEFWFISCYFILCGLSPLLNKYWCPIKLFWCYLC